MSFRLISCWVEKHFCSKGVHTFKTWYCIEKCDSDIFFLCLAISFFFGSYQMLQYISAMWSSSNLEEIYRDLHPIWNEARLPMSLTIDSSYLGWSNHDGVDWGIALDSNVAVAAENKIEIQYYSLLIQCYTLFHKFLYS